MSSPSTNERKKETMKKIVRGGLALVSIIVTSVMLASGAQAATPDQQNTANYVSSMRNAAGLPSLSINEQMNGSAQAWADHLAEQDSRNLSTDPSIYKPSGTTNGASVVAYYSRNDPKAAMDSAWGTNASNKSIIDTPSWNTVGTGVAVSKSGAVYLVADMVHVKPPVVMAPPAPAPIQAPVQVPAPVIPQPAPVQAAPEQAPAQADPAPAPAAPEVPAPEAPTPTVAPMPKENANPSATPTATATSSPSATATASASATASPEGQTMDALRTSGNTSPLGIGKESKQAMGFGAGGLLFISGGIIRFRNRPQKETGN